MNLICSHRGLEVTNPEESVGYDTLSKEGLIKYLYRSSMFRSFLTSHQSTLKTKDIPMIFFDDPYEGATPRNIRISTFGRYMKQNPDTKYKELRFIGYTDAGVIKYYDNLGAIVATSEIYGLDKYLKFNARL